MLKNWIRKYKDNKKEKETTILKMHYKKMYDKKIDELIKEHGKELNIIAQRHNEIIKNKKIWFENEISKIREQEQGKYKIVIDERDMEIERLQKHIKKHKKILEDIKEKEIAISDVVKEVNKRFEKGLRMVAEGFQKMQSAQGDIDNFSRKAIKNEQKELSALKEH
jgi:hypothetical protein